VNSTNVACRRPHHGGTRPNTAFIDANPAAAPFLALRAAWLSAARAVAIDRDSLELLAQRTLPLPAPWPSGPRELLVRILLEGVGAIAAIEALDHCGISTRILPEWEPVRSPNATPITGSPSIDTCSKRRPTPRVTDRIARRMSVVGALLQDLGRHSGRSHDVGRRAGAPLGGTHRI